MTNKSDTTLIPDGTFITDNFGKLYEYKSGHPVLIESTPVIEQKEESVDEILEQKIWAKWGQTLYTLSDGLNGNTLIQMIRPQIL